MTSSACWASLSLSSSKVTSATPPCVGAFAKAWMSFYIKPRLARCRDPSSTRSATTNATSRVSSTCSRRRDSPECRLSFTPPTSGTYVLNVSGGNARTQVLIWVGGAESAAWADLPSQRLHLTLDKDSYKPGDTAKVFVPNPFATNALALVTVEAAVDVEIDDTPGRCRRGAPLRAPRWRDRKSTRLNSSHRT